LYQHQIDAIKFMLDIEDKIVSGENVLKVYPVIPLGRDSDYVLDLDHGVVMLREKMEDSDHPALETHFRGGMLSSTVGSGKTVSALSVIAARRNQNYHTAMCSTLDMEYLIQTNASLIVTPNNIPRQWYDQLKKFFGDVHDIIADRHVTIPKSRNPIKVLLLLDQRNLKKTTVQDVIDADIIITTIQLLSNEPYISNMQSTFYAAQVAPMDEETEQIDLSEINNENIAKAAKKRRKKNDDGASSSTDGASQQSISA
jgi:SNF2 family DNA or RNA helicase